jgi:hypothetical protein
MFPLLKLFIDNHSSDCNIPRLIFLCYLGTPHQELPELSPKSMPSFPGNGPALLDYQAVLGGPVRWKNVG